MYQRRGPDADSADTLIDSLVENSGRDGCCGMIAASTR